MVSGAASEQTPLLGKNVAATTIATQEIIQIKTWRHHLFDFLEAKTRAGRFYESFIILLIALNVLAFILGSLFVVKYNPVPWAELNGDESICGNVCDSLWFGNYSDNMLEFLNLGNTSVLELVTIAVFTIEYLLRLYTADLINPTLYGDGVMGRLRWIPTFFSMVDLASTLPFYIDAIFLRDSDLVATAFVRMFRLFRMMRVEGRYDSALCLVDDVYLAQRGILGTALFVGFTTWVAVSSLYYLVERKNYDFIYCGAAPDYCKDGGGGDIDTSLCTIDHWGITDCTAAGCPSSEEYPEPCYNLYNSIPMASYYALLNLFGEFPHIDEHSSAGKVVGSLTAIVAVAVFALPAGIIGNGFEQVISKRRQEQRSAEENNNGVSSEEDDIIIEEGGMTTGFVATTSTLRGRWYNFLHAQTSPTARAFDSFINVLVLLTALSFMLDTLKDEITGPLWQHAIWDCIELIAVCIFTVEYVFRVYSAAEDPKYSHDAGGRFLYMTTFLAMVDLLSFVPYWLQVAMTGQIIASASFTSTTAIYLVKSLRLLRIFRFEKYTHAFTSFDDVIRRNADVLSVTAFSAILIWVFFAAWLYFTERDNPDEEIASNYSTVPNAMWLTLLNLSGESPLSEYTMAGKVATALLGLCATGIFGIPIGVLGAGFEEVVEQENEDDTRELGIDDDDAPGTTTQPLLGTRGQQQQQDSSSSVVTRAYIFVNGIGSTASTYFELSIFFFIFLAVAVGVWQTVEGHENDFSAVEGLAVGVFTLEYLIRLVGAGADPIACFKADGTRRNPLMSRLRFMVSFYSIVDLLAIVPFYAALAMPSSVVNEYDEYLRMLRIIRLVKLDKYVPSLTLIDDVIRLKFKTLRVAFYAAMTLWILFTAALFLCEHKDYDNGIDPVPTYGCVEDCSMVDRFQNFFDSMVYTGIHLTGDYPIITYTWPGRFVNFFMVIAAVGVVSIPSGLIASGFVEIVQSRNKKRHVDADPNACAGDDWYEISYRKLEGVDPPRSLLGLDYWQNNVNVFLNGETVTDAHGKEHTYWSNTAFASRIFIFTIIITNVIAVLAESVPRVDKAVGNEPGNFFDVFEAFSVMVFAAEYMLRLFCAPKNREALYSTWVYATTFFGIVDFLSTAPWFIEHALIATGFLDESGDTARIFRIFRVFRILQLEDFVVAFSKLDNVFRASKDVLKATGLLALIIWVGCGALFFIFEENNPNWRHCDPSIPLSLATSNASDGVLGCYDFASTTACNEQYPGMCSQKAFVDMPNALYYTAVFLGGEWGVIDFTWGGRFVCLFLCVVGIALYAIPIGTLFESFGAVLGLAGDEDEDKAGNGSDDKISNEAEKDDDGKSAKEKDNNSKTRGPSGRGDGNRAKI